MNFKSKYHQKTIQLCLLKVVLFFSVCAFSGFNGLPQSTYLKSVKTELVDSTTNESTSRLFNIKKGRNKVISFKFLLGISSYNHYWILLNFDTSLSTAYKSICNKFLSYHYTHIELLTKAIPLSSEDEDSASFSFV